MRLSVRNLEKAYRAVRLDIYALCRALNFLPTKQQRELLDAVAAGQRRIACKSGQGPGKTSVSCVIALWRLLRYEGSMVVVTAPTMRQCKDVWLTEFRRILRRGDPWISCFVEAQRSRVVVVGDPDWGIKLVTATREENAQGFHEEHLTVIGDEASGIPREIVTQFKGTLSNPDSLFLLIGNPNTRDCAFFDCFHAQQKDWERITFNAEETPISSWFHTDRNKLVEEEFGRDSDVYRVRVLGEFPHADPNCIFTEAMLDRMQDQSRMVDASAQNEVRQFGLDFARHGGDESVLFMRVGNSIMEWVKKVRKEPSEVVLLAFQWQKDMGWRDNTCLYVADASGIGQGILHKFYDEEKRVLEFHNGGRSTEPRKYANRITEAWFTLRQRVIQEVPVCIPDDRILRQQLTTRQYFMNRKGQLILETKDEYKKRGHESPDRADALVMAMYDSAMTEDCVSNIGGTERSLRASVQIR